MGDDNIKEIIWSNDPNYLSYEGWKASNEKGSPERLGMSEAEGRAHFISMMEIFKDSIFSEMDKEVPTAIYAIRKTTLNGTLASDYTIAETTEKNLKSCLADTPNSTWYVDEKLEFRSEQKTDTHTIQSVYRTLRQDLLEADIRYLQNRLARGGLSISEFAGFTDKLGVRVLRAVQTEKPYNTKEEEKERGLDIWR